MSLRFMKLDSSFFRRAWKWDEFIELYHNRGCDLQKFYCNQIIALLFGTSTAGLSKMNENLPKSICIGTESHSDIRDVAAFEADNYSKLNTESLQELTFKSNVITGVEGVYLPIFDKCNFEFYNDNQETFNNIVKVDSTKMNLRSLALGVSSGKAICLSGPVGCGKTSLVEFLARKTGRLAPKANELLKFLESKKKPKVRGSKRKLRNTEIENEQNDEPTHKTASKNGFLRIQLGDQTDSKVLLGQYRCTDVPGEFLWQPGVLTQAVLNGYWLLLEDLDSATQDVCTVLTNLLENNFLNVPGFRENLKIAPGFQLFVTLR